MSGKNGEGEKFRFERRKKSSWNSSISSPRWRLRSLELNSFDKAIQYRRKIRMTHLQENFGPVVACRGRANRLAIYPCCFGRGGELWYDLQHAEQEYGWLVDQFGTISSAYTTWEWWESKNANANWFVVVVLCGYQGGVFWDCIAHNVSSVVSALDSGVRGWSDDRVGSGVGSRSMPCTQDERDGHGEGVLARSFWRNGLP